MPNNILITGQPKSGKSTLIKNIIANLPHTVGCVATEVREGTERIGFDIVTSTDKRSPIARVDVPTAHHVSKYFVDIPSLESVLDAITSFNNDDILYIDEIGEMQMYSKKFQQLANTYIDAENICIALVSQIYEDDFIRQVKSRPDSVHYHLTPHTREYVYTQIIEAIKGIQKKIKKSQRYTKEPERFDIQQNKTIMRSTHATRTLFLKDHYWHCSCDFFKTYHTCSHSMALRHILRTRLISDIPDK